MPKDQYIKDDINNEQDPSNDFYEYAIGNWLKKTTIPDDYSRYGSFEVLIEENFKKLKDLLEEPDAAATTAAEKELANKVGIFYRQGMDETSIEKNGTVTLKKFLDKIAKMETRNDFVDLVAEFHSMHIPVLFHFLSTPDAKNSKWVIGGLAQGGLGLFERNYYLDKEHEEIRNKYLQLIQNMFDLVGAEAKAETVLKIETALANISRTKEDLRDPVKNYNKMQRRQLVDTAPEFHWQEYFLKVGAEEVVDIDVGQPDFFSGLNDLIGSIGLAEWRSYFAWHLILNTADYLTKDLVDEKFNFYGKVMQGQPKMKDRTKRVIMTVDGHVGEAVGKLYVAKYFPPSAKARAEELVENIVAAMGERIENLTWMSEETKKAALKKLANIDVKIGYPSKWKDYSNWMVGETYLETVLNARRFEWQREMEKINKPVDRTEWLMSPQTVNAYYEPLKNEIVFPAGILQAPFFSNDVDDALNYGGIGTVIGHEITHGFDDQGRQFDKDGNLLDWWTEEDGKKFKSVAERFVSQYNEIEVLPGINLNGQFTLGENIADLGGVCVAFQALHKIADLTPVDGFTPEQRFFLSYAQTEKNLIRPEKLKMQIMIDPHSPGKYRVNVPLSNLEEFYLAFGVKNGKMFRSPELRVSIW